MPRIPQYKSNAFRKQLIVWARASAPNRASNIEQSATDELLAEHQLTESALSAMEAEAYRLAHQQAYRPEFWSGMVDFVGNFIHLCHRKKEEACLFPMLAEYGMKDQVDVWVQDHGHAETMTFDLLEALGEADWEKVLRLVSMYVPSVRAHMATEEKLVFVPRCLCSRRRRWRGCASCVMSSRRRSCRRTGGSITSIWCAGCVRTRGCRIRSRRKASLRSPRAI